MQQRLYLMKTVNISQKQKKSIDITICQWGKEGFLLQMAPDQYLLGAGPFLSSSRPVQDKWSLFYPPFFFSEPKTDSSFWHIPSVTALLSKEELFSFLKDQKMKRDILNKKWKKPPFSDFQYVFLNAQKQIAQNKIQKVVPVFFETADYSLTKKDVPALVHRLVIRAEKKGTVYAFWSGQKAVMGCTPEYLFRKEGLYVQTMALAGTARDSQHDLLKDPKEKWEHHLVVEEIKTILASLGQYRFSDTYMYSVGDICHLRTDFKLQLKKDIPVKKLCHLMHPTPALGGFPGREALDLLMEFQKKHDARYGFGAPFGVSINHKAFCVVAIRNIQFINGKMYIGSGCGLVKESQMEREWEEINKKSQFIKDILF